MHERGRFSVVGAPVMWSLTYAYRLKDIQISGAPAWLNQFDSAYDIEGRPAQPVSNDECRLMLQSLFAERFKLAAHREMRESGVYFLGVGKNGPKLQEGGGVRLNGGVAMLAPGKPQWPDGLTMEELAGILTNYTDRPILDRTALPGTYGISLDFSLPDRDGPSIFTAVQEQLGLKLEASTRRSTGDRSHTEARS